MKAYEWKFCFFSKINNNYQQNTVIFFLQSQNFNLLIQDFVVYWIIFQLHQLSFADQLLKKEILNNCYL